MWRRRMPPSMTPDARRNALLLATANAINGSAAPLAVTLGGLVGFYLLGPDTPLATVPIACLNLGVADRRDSRRTAHAADRPPPRLHDRLPDRVFRLPHRGARDLRRLVSAFHPRPSRPWRRGVFHIPVPLRRRRGRQPGAERPLDLLGARRRHRLGGRRPATGDLHPPPARPDSLCRRLRRDGRADLVGLVVLSRLGGTPAAATGGRGQARAVGRSARSPASRASSWRCSAPCSPSAS